MDHGLIKGKRKAGSVIMAYALGHYSYVSDLRSLDRIRLSFQVNNMSELCSANGKDIDDRFFLNKHYK